MMDGIVMAADLSMPINLRDESGRRSLKEAHGVLSPEIFQFAPQQNAPIT